MFVRKPKPVIHYGDGSERRAGLTNYASSCYMNSTLQAMAACQPLQDLLLPPGVDGQALATSPALRTIGGEEAMADHLEDFPISMAWIQLLRQLYDSKASQKTISTSKLHKVLSRKNPDYDGISQQDAHEALLAVADQMRLEEVDAIKAISPPPSRPAPKGRQGTVTLLDPSASSVAPSEQDPPDDSSSSDSDDDEPGASTSETKAKLEPFIDTLFDGKLKSFIVCDTCKNVSISTEPFIDLSLAIQDDGKARRKSRLRSFFSKDSGASSAGTTSDRPVTSLSKMPENPADENDNAVDSSESDDNEQMTQSLQLERAREAQKSGAAARRRSSLDPSYLKEKWAKRKERRASVLHGSDSDRARRPSTSTSSRRPGHSPARFPFDATAPISEPDEETTQGSPVLDRNLTKAETAYLKTVLAEVPAKSPQQASPLDRLRVSRPGGSRMAVGPTNQDEVQQAPKSPSGATFEQDQSTSDLYRALQKFTAVEVLEGDNAFQCKNCWKLTNPQFVKPKKPGHGGVNVPYAPDSTLKSGAKAADLVAQLGLESDTEDEQVVKNNHPSSKHSSIPSVQVSNGAPSDQGASFVQSTASSDADNSSNASDGSADADNEDDIDESQSDAPASRQSRKQHHLSADTSPSQSTSSVPPTPKKPPKSERYLPRKAHKRYLIDSLPKILIVHFNRFQQTKPGVLAASIGNSLFSTLRKIDDFVSFSEIVDMSPFLAPSGPAPKIGQPLQESAASTERETQSETVDGPSAEATVDPTPGRTRKRSSTIVPERALEADPRLTHCNYRLVAIVVHSGSMAGGHYISYVNVPVAKPKHPSSNPHTASSDTALCELNADKASLNGHDGREAATAPPSLHDASRPASPPTSQQDQSTSASGPGGSQEQKAAPEPVEKQWLYCSDEEIRPAHITEVMTCKAYLLYYERIDN